MWAHSLVAPATFARVEVPSLTAADLADGQVLLRTLAGGICGSDLPYFRGLRPLFDLPSRHRYAAGIPGFPMHEVVGEILASRHPDRHPGERVVGWANTTDALAEFVVTGGTSVAPYDPRLAPETAVLLQPLACVLYAVRSLPPVAGATVAVIGQGPIGLLFSHVLKSMGAARVIGVDRVRRDGVAAQYGVDESVHAVSDRWAGGLTEGERPRIVVEAVGHHPGPIRDAVEAVAPGGYIMYFGVPDELLSPFPMWDLLRKNLTVSSGITLDHTSALVEAMSYLDGHPELADGYVTNVFPADQAQAAYDLAAVPAERRLKVVLSMA